MVIKAEVRIKAPMAVVWRTLSNLGRWKDWNTGCASCCFNSGDRRAEGA
jgi:carbon monoxide dehydrogenase subunit G